MSLLDHIKPRERTPRVKVHAELLKWIRANRLCAGSKLPPQAQLAKALGVGAGTVHHAMAGLVEQGIVRRRPGEGTILLRSPDEVPEVSPQENRRIPLESVPDARIVGPLGFVYVRTEADADMAKVLPSTMNTQWLTISAVEKALGAMQIDPAATCMLHWPEDVAPDVALLRSGVRGAVVYWSSHAAHTPQRESLRLAMRRATVPVVNVNEEPFGVLDLPNVVFTDQVAIGTAAARHLCDLGHRRLMAVHSSHRFPFEQERIKGFAGFVEPGQGHVTLCEGGEPGTDGDWMPVGRKAFAAWASSATRTTRPTGVFCVNDCTAVGFILAAQAAGVRVPEDVSVMGVDNYPALFYPYGIHLTTLDQQFDEVGAEAVRLLERLLNGEAAHATIIKVQPRLVVRSTHGRVS